MSRLILSCLLVQFISATPAQASLRKLCLSALSYLSPKAYQVTAAQRAQALAKRNEVQARVLRVHDSLFPPLDLTTSNERQFFSDAVDWVQKMESKGWRLMDDLASGGNYPTRAQTKALEERFKQRKQATVYTTGMLGLAMEAPPGYLDNAVLTRAQRGNFPSIWGGIYYYPNWDLDFAVVTANPQQYVEANLKRFNYQMMRYGNNLFAAGFNPDGIGVHPNDLKGNLFFVRGEDAVKYVSRIRLNFFMNEVILEGSTEELAKHAVGVQWVNLPAGLVQWPSPSVRPDE